MTNTILVLKEGKDYDVVEPVSGTMREVHPVLGRRFTIISAKQRIADFKSLDKAGKKKFLEKQKMSEKEWLEQVNKQGDLFMSRYTITMEDFDAFCYDTNSRLPNDMGWGRGLQAGINISIIDSVKYVNWANQKVGLSPKYILANTNDGVYIWTHPKAVRTANDIIREAEQAVGRELTDDEKLDLVEVKAHLRIPTSDEWVSCLNRPNEDYEFPGSNDLKEVAWYADNSDNHAHEVGKLKPNSYGIYDMYGNVWEMCLAQHPPVMTTEEWNKWWPNIPYMDMSNEEIFGF